MKVMIKKIGKQFKSGVAMLCLISMLISMMSATAISIAAEELSNASGVEVGQVPMQTVYDEPATDWEKESLPLGNGFLGASVFGGVDSERILINEHTIWSGGPGADADYDGGMSNGTTTEEKQEALKNLREGLGDLLVDFSENYTPGIGAENTSNYPGLSSQLTQYINTLKGEKDNFGCYQELGSIKIDKDRYGYLTTAYGLNCYNPNYTGKNSVSYLFDNNQDTKWFSGDGGVAGEVYDGNDVLVLEYDERVPVEGYTMKLANDTVKYGRTPRSWKLYASNDKTTWTEIHHVTDSGFSSESDTYEQLSYTLPEMALYRYFKFEFLSVDGGGKSSFGVQLSELALAFSDSFGYPYITSRGNKETNANQSVNKVFDGDITTKWYTLAGTPAGTTQDFPVSVQIENQVAFKIASYSIVSASDASHRDPRDWNLYGSNDGIEWTVIDTRSAESFSERDQEKKFELSKTYEYRFIRLEVIAVQNNKDVGGGLQMSELNFYDPDGKKIEFFETPENYQRGLDIDNALANVNYSSNGVDYAREYFVSNPGNFIGARLTVSDGATMTRYISFSTPHTTATVTASGDTITITGWPADHVEEEKLIFAAQIKVITDGDIVARGSYIEVKDASEIILYMTAGTNYQQCMDDSFDYFSDEDPLDAVKARLAALEGKTYEELKSAHIADYKELYDRVKIDIGGIELPNKMTDDLIDGYRDGTNTDAENRYLETVYYQFGRYLMIASSREGSLPANLQGIWAEGLAPKWNSDYHTNINVQMNYWIAEQTNLSECHQPLIDYTNSLVERGKITANTYHYNVNDESLPVRGWTTYHENNIWGNTHPATSAAFYFPTGAAWLCQHIWEQYAFNLDKDQLAANYDTLKGAALFWVDNLIADPRDGKLVVGPSRSPEHGPYSFGCSADQVMVWELFNNTLKAAEVLGDKSSEINEIRNSMNNLALPEIGVNGQYMEWRDEITLDVTGDNQHRHVNHLYALQPGTLVVAGRSEEDDKYIEAMKQTLETRGDEGTGWSIAWKMNFWARIRDGEHTGLMLSQILKRNTYDNLFDAIYAPWSTPFQIDANFGAVSGVTEMFVQSHGDSIDLLPALSSAWYGGSVSGLRARGNVTVDIESAEDGSLEKAVLKVGTANEALKVRANGLSKFVVMNSEGKEVKVNYIDEATITFAAEAGETYVLVEDTSSEENGGDSNLNPGKPDNSDQPDNSDEVITNHDNCQGNWFAELWNAIVNFFRRLVGLPEKCICGENIDY